MQAYHNSFYAMGTRFNAVFAFEDSGICESAFQLLHSEVLRIEKRLNYFDPGSDISIINNKACFKSLTLDDELFGIIVTCLNYSALTNGAYDITMRYFAELDDKSTYTYSPLAEKIIIDAETKSLRLRNESIKMDLGGFGKGYALEKVKGILTATPIKNCLISFGESSVLALGNHPAGNCWQIGVMDLLNPAISAYKADLYNSSLSVSSNFFSDENNGLLNIHHIVNPLTLTASDEIKTSIVQSSSPLQAEILSTAFMNMKHDEITTLLKKLPEVKAVMVQYEDDKRKTNYLNV